MKLAKWINDVVGPQIKNPRGSHYFPSCLCLSRIRTVGYRRKSETPAIRKVANYVRYKKLSGATRSLHRDRCKNVLSAAASHSGSLKFANATCRNETSRQRLFYLEETPVRKKCPPRNSSPRNLRLVPSLDSWKVFPRFLGLFRFSLLFPLLLLPSISLSLSSDNTMKSEFANKVHFIK